MIMKKQPVQLGVLTYMGLEARVSSVPQYKTGQKRKAPLFYTIEVYVDGRTYPFTEVEEAMLWLEQEAMLRRQGLRAALLSALKE
jgi:hypothetical protein